MSELASPLMLPERLPSTQGRTVARRSRRHGLLRSLTTLMVITVGLLSLLLISMLMLVRG